jgi:hypothetical protein
MRRNIANKLTRLWRAVTRRWRTWSFSAWSSFAIHGTVLRLHWPPVWLVSIKVSKRVRSSGRRHTGLVRLQSRADEIEEIPEDGWSSGYALEVEEYRVLLERSRSEVQL